MSTGAPPSSPDPHSSRAVAPSAPLAMPSPPPAPPAAAGNENRPLPPKKAKSFFPYAVNCVFGGVNRACGMALVGLHVGLCILNVLTFTTDLNVLTFTTDPEEAEFWLRFWRAWLYLCIAAAVVTGCQCICYYMPVYGVYARSRKLDPPQQQSAAAAEQLALPPPPPEMDMC